MNRLISVGLSIAVAPAILLGIGQWLDSPDIVVVSQIALFRFALPLGALLVVVGLCRALIGTWRKQARARSDSQRSRPTPEATVEDPSSCSVTEAAEEQGSPLGGQPAPTPMAGHEVVLDGPHPAKRWLQVAIVLDLVKTLVIATMYIKGATPAEVVPVGLLRVAALWLLLFMVNRQFNWARYALLLVAIFYIPGGIRALMTFSDGAFQLVTLAESVALLGAVGMLFGRRYDAWFADPSLAGMSGTFEGAEPEEAVPAPLIEREENPAIAMPEAAIPETLPDAETEPVGWSFWQWALTFWLVFFVVLAGGTKAHNANDQNFLYGVIALQTLIGTVLVRTVLGIFSSRRASRIVFKIALALLLCVPLFGLSLCSSFAQHRWGGY